VGSQILWLCVVLRCMTIWSCAQQQVSVNCLWWNLPLLHKPMMLVWGHSQSCEMICLLLYPGFWDLAVVLVLLCVWGAYPVGYVPNTTWSCACSYSCYTKLASEAQAEAAILVCINLALRLIPVMSLAKHFFAKLRDSQQTLPCMVSCFNSGRWCARLNTCCWRFTNEILL
jgi:hypothetical protein